MTKEKVKIHPSVKINIGFIGLQIITTYTAAISVADIWINVFSNNIYTMFNYVGSIPVVALALFIPLLMKFVSISKIFYINAVAQIISSAVLIFIPTMKLKLGRDTALAITILFLLISSSGFAVSQTAIFAFAAEFSNQTVQFYITGLSVANLLYGLYFLPFPYYVKNLQTRMIYYFILPLVVHFASVIIFYFTSKKIPKKEERRGIEKNETKLEQSIMESFKVVLKKKWLYFLLNFFLYLGTFLVYPSFMFQATSSNSNLTEFWPKILMIIFGISEVCARVINTLKIQFIVDGITEGNIWIFCIMSNIVCLFPIFTFLAMRGVFYMSPLVIDICNGVFYGIVAFSLGLLGNNIASFAYSNLGSDREVQVAGSLFNLSIVVPILLGLMISHFISKAVQ